MTPRKLIALSLWAVVLAGVAFLGYQGLTGAGGESTPSSASTTGSTNSMDEDSASPADAESPTASAPDVRVVVYYFHTDSRCETCVMLEREGREAVEGQFAEALNGDALAFRAVNVERAANRHYVEAFDIYGSSLFGVLYEGEETKRVEDLTAPLYRGEISSVEAYRRHVVEGVETLLRAADITEGVH